MSEMLLTAYNGSILGPIARFLGWVMNGIYFLMAKIGIENVGLTIILFTIVVYAFMFPLTYKQQKFSKLSQKMQPELQKISEKYKNKKDQASMLAMQEEQRAVYDKYGVSMTGSCVQMLIQMPILLALYRVFMNVPAYVSGVKGNFTELVNGIMATSGYQEKMTTLMTELRILVSPTPDFTVTDDTRLFNSIVDVLNKMSTLGWDSLKETFPSLTETISATYETVSHVNSFGPLNISDTPWFIIKNNFTEHNFVIAFVALLIPVISYATQVINIKFMPQTANNNANSSNGTEADTMAQQMKTMNNVMPLFSLVMCFSVPVGLGIYWIASAVVRAIQQYVLNRHFEKIDLDDIIKKNQEKAKKKREKMGIAQNQIYNAAKLNTRTMEDRSKVAVNVKKEELAEKADAAKSSAKPGSMAAKANLVREYNERNSR